MESSNQKVTLTGCYNCIKISLIVFNIVLWILGWVIFGVGVAGVSNGDFHFHLGGHYPHLYTAAVLFIIIGLFIVAIGFFGCFGAFRESKVLLAMYYVSLMLVFILLMFAAQWAIANQSSVVSTLHGFLPERISKYSSDSEFMDKLQTTFECCGDRSAYDYSQGPPVSCGETLKERYQRTGCTEKLMQFVQDHMSKFIAAGITVSFILIIGLAFAMTMCFALGEIGR